MAGKKRHGSGLNIIRPTFSGNGASSGPPLRPSAAPVQSWKDWGLPRQIATHLLQILLHQVAGEAFDLRLLIDPIIVGHGGR
jgi:hypothetical protein